MDGRPQSLRPAWLLRLDSRRLDSRESHEPCTRVGGRTRTPGAAPETAHVIGIVIFVNLTGGCPCSRLLHLARGPLGLPQIRSAYWRRISRRAAQAERRGL